MVALIPAAGYGTRFLPASKTVPKEMLPIGNKPAIQRIVEEAVAAGAEKVVVVTSPDKPSLKAHFDVDAVWHARLAKKPEIDAEMTQLEKLGRKIEWAYQIEQKGLGHAVLQAAENCRGADRVLILLGDALVSGCTAAKEMAAVSASHANASVIGCELVPMEKVSRYGIMKPEVAQFTPAGGSSFKLADIVEKPRVEKAPSNLAVAGRYLLDGAIFDYLKEQTPGVGGEIQLTDSIRRMLSVKSVYGYVYPGRRHDIGNPMGYFETLKAFSQEF